MSKFLSVRQLAEANPAFSESALRWMIHRSKTNGLEVAIVRIGRKVLLDVEAFEGWVRSHRPVGGGK